MVEKKWLLMNCHFEDENEKEMDTWSVSIFFLIIQLHAADTIRRCAEMTRRIAAAHKL